MEIVLLAIVCLLLVGVIRTLIILDSLNDKFTSFNEQLRSFVQDESVIRDDIHADTVRFGQIAGKFSGDMAISRVALSAIGKRIKVAQDQTPTPSTSPTVTSEVVGP